MLEEDTNNQNPELIKTIIQFITEAIESASLEIDEAEDADKDIENVESVIGKHITKRLSYMKDEGFISDFKNEFDQNKHD